MTSGLLRHWFAHPWLLWLLAVLPLLGLLGLWSRHRRRAALALLGGGPAFASALTRSRRRGPWLFLSLWVGLSLLIVSAAGPQWGRDWNQSATVGRDLVVVLDLSSSMHARDSRSRLERAREALLDLCETIRKRGGHRLGLVVFAARARLVCPLTHDYDHFRQSVLGINEKRLHPSLWTDDTHIFGTRIGAGLVMAVATHTEEAAGVQDILLLSDGDDLPAADNEWQEGIVAARERNIPINTVGIGDPDTPRPIPVDDDFLLEDDFHLDEKGNKVRKRVMTKLEERPLKEIAAATDGKYLPLHKSEYPLGELYLTWIAAKGEHEHQVDALPVYRQRAAWFLTPALGLLVLSLFVGEGRRTKIPER